MASYKELFTRLYKEIADCEAPKGTQVDDVLAAFQGDYEIAILNETYTYLVEVGKGDSKYNVRYSWTSDSIITPSRALLHYHSLNTHSGHKKRLVRVNNVDKTRLVLDRVIS